MKKVIVSLASLVISLVLCGTARAQAHRNAYGGSTSHSYGSTSHTNAYGGSSSHTAGQGTSHTSTYGTSTSHAYGGGTSHTNAYGGTTTGAYGAGAVHTTPYGTTAYASAYHPPAAYYGYHPPATAAYYQTGCYNCVSTGGAAAAGAVVGMAVGAAAASSNTSAQSASAYSAGYSAGAANASTANATLRLRMLMRRQQTPMRPRRTPMSPLPMRVLLRAPPTSRIRWAQFMGRYLPAASVPTSRGAEPIICAVTPGSVRPMVRMVSSIAWCPHRREKVHRSDGAAFAWKRIQKTEEIL